jgi:hypothetical protein
MGQIVAPSPNVTVKPRLTLTDKFTLTDMGSGLAPHYFENTDREIVRPMLANGDAQFPQFTFGHGTADMLTPAAIQRLVNLAVFDMGNADIFLTLYGQAVDYVVAVGPLFAFCDHGHNIA